MVSRVVVVVVVVDNADSIEDTEISLDCRERTKIQFPLSLSILLYYIYAYI